MYKSKSLITMGARNYSIDDRECNDFYATPSLATELLIKEETFSKYIWEPACGMGNISEILFNNNFIVYNTDIINRGYKKQNETIDFMTINNLPKDYHKLDIITNPPYKYAMEFAEHALDIIEEGCKVAMFLKLTFLEGKRRKKFFIEKPFKTLYVSSSRLTCAKNGDFEKYKNTPTAFGWYVWEKGFNGTPNIKWFN